ncbi:MAG: hypothetical protein HYR83_14615 [Planctomycetes bacterium]|nr:hypothetical protein [Planctomycetota bacterium]
MGKFFGVPLLIIGTIVGGAVVVVLLFGGPAAPDERSIADLLQALESNSGVRSAGVLLPREKESWQAALELSERLRNKDKELTPQQLLETAARLSTMVRSDYQKLISVPASGEAELPSQLFERSHRFEFLLRALARTEVDEAVDPLIEIASMGREPYVEIAIQQLGEMHEVAAARKAIPAILHVLESADRAETKLVACTVLSLLAKPGDQQVIEALTAVRSQAEGEVEWNATLALARLGSSNGKTTLVEILDRSFWEKGERYVKVDEGVAHRYTMPPGRVDALLVAAIEGASHLPDADLWSQIERLQSDVSPTVQSGAKAALEKARRQKGDGLNPPVSPLGKGGGNG